jgi:signal transduction histidine kinase/AmiR/NasT family two-component response regulator
MLSSPSLDRDRRRFAPIAHRSQHLLIVSAVIFVIAQTLVALLGIAGMSVSEVVRAYVTGEAQYSKAQQESALSLESFIQSGADGDFARYLAALDVMNGDRAARLTLESKSPDLRAAAVGFRHGRNATADVPAMVRGFLVMQRWPPFALAVEDWREADAKVVALEGLGDRIRTKASTAPDRAARLAEARELDRTASVAERRFSDQMGRVARLVTSLAYAAVAALSLAVCATGMWVALRVHQVWVRTAEELAEARDRAEQANRAKGDFLANISHEIRTPLNGVLGMVQILRRDERDAEKNRRLDVIGDAGQALLSVLDGVLDLSKIDAGRLEAERHAFDIEEIVRLATAPHATLAGQKEVRFAVDWRPDAKGIWLGDGGKLRQVLSNLLSNALKFTADGSIVLRIAPSLSGLRFDVEDTGLGIAADKQAMVFEPFSQADASTTRQFGGTGLGLAICRQFVALLGGDLKLHSELGVGSTFSFDLPMPRGAQEAPMVEHPHEPAPGTGPDARRVHILAAEDNPTNQLILRALLEPFNIELTVVADGREAVEAWASGAYELILMDVQMPILNGPAATIEIRSRERAEGRPRIPIIALTANVMRHQIESYAGAGMDGFVSKPIEMSELLGAIEAALAEDKSEELNEQAV